jgi:hypothetical protein
MFEIIGLLFASAFLFASAAAVSAILAGFTWLLMRKRQSAPQKRLILMAPIIPIFSAAYMWLCVAVLPGESLFGDIDEPLPNGYVVKALAKMPDFAGISDPKSPWRYPQLSECIGKLAVVGQLVVGQYSHPCDTFSPKPDEPYFIFDTHTGKTTDLSTLSALQEKLGQPVNLTEVQFFRSPLAQKRRSMDKAIEFGPPIIALILLIAFVGHYCTRIDPISSNIYT